MARLIEVNLLPGDKKKRKAGGAELKLPNLSELTERIRDPLLVGAVAAIVVGVLASAYIYFDMTSTLDELRPQVESLEREKRRYNREIALRRSEENLADSLRSELERVRRIDSDRFVWPHVMEEIARALPEYTWLTSVEELAVPVPTGRPAADTTQVEDPPPRIQIFGRTSDMQGYTRFLSQLADSPWLADVRGGRTEVVTEQERSVREFTVNVTYQVADSAFIETVPVLSSVQ